ncbi:type II toxin-antitoxin system HipA family toxin [Pleionea sediminis]|uniref:type II toxin-antitoxin system HipA family toxin n=1 Tax=Pleionea sediminis TaxID=2569479 RepID=UPI0011868999|nr:type II toxin-antitoxin system HipA family toxin [Pleionea sediminis]
MVKARKLIVWMNGHSVGEWSINRGRDRFEYYEAWVNNPIGRPLSLSLPFTPNNDAYQGDTVANYFDNLLPDHDDIRRRLAKKLRADSTKPFDLLAEAGRDCVGALQLLPEGLEPESLKSIEGEQLNEADVAKLLRNTLSDDTLGLEVEDELRLSLAGAQEKTALLWHKDQWYRPTGATPTTHIFKLPLGLVANIQADMSGSVENEWLCSKILEAFGLPVASCDIGQFEDQKVLIVERFDRRLSLDKQWIMRIPQEDFCQALGHSMHLKYESDGGPGIEQCMRVLDSSSQRAIDRDIFFKSQIIFYLLFATDGHAKNFSIQHIDRQNYLLTPLYDVLSVAPILGEGPNQMRAKKATIAMSLKSKNRHKVIEKIQRRHFVAQAQRVGYSEEEGNTLIDDVISKVDSVLDLVSNQLPDKFPKYIEDSVLSLMAEQAKKLIVK